MKVKNPKKEGKKIQFPIDLSVSTGTLFNLKGKKRHNNHKPTGKKHLRLRLRAAISETSPVALFLVSAVHLVIFTSWSPKKNLNKNN